ncbi:MAG TPA: hypothetical protein VGV38_22585, partial [Pyrinomonadaceae bacterium]|nr:hypothetical protein [Pyrinomonadaceae bacterium]
PTRRGSAGGAPSGSSASASAHASNDDEKASAGAAHAPHSPAKSPAPPSNAAAESHAHVAAPQSSERKPEARPPVASDFEPETFDEASPFDHDEAPPFEPPPPRVAPAAPQTSAAGSRAKPIPTLPKVGAPATAAGSTAAIPSLPSKHGAATPKNDAHAPRSASQQPSQPAHAADASPPSNASQPSHTSQAPNTSQPPHTSKAAQASQPPAQTLPPSTTPTGLRLVPSPSSTDGGPRSFFDAPAADDLFARRDGADASRPAPPGVAASPPAFDDGPSRAPSNGAAPPTGAPESGLLPEVKRLLDERRRPFLSIALEGARKVVFEPEELYVEFAPEGKHLRDTLSKPDNVKVLREVCAEVAGRGVGVRIVVREPGEEEDAPLQTKQDEARQEKQRLRELAEQHPDVQKMLRTFRAEIIDVRLVEEPSPTKPAPPVPKRP